jgi:hypothetical protein
MALPEDIALAASSISRVHSAVWMREQGKPVACVIVSVSICWLPEQSHKISCLPRVIGAFCPEFTFALLV